jgi:DNA-binding PadR family transcriptional regulator
MSQNQNQEQRQRRVYVQTDGGQDIFHTLFACVAQHGDAIEAITLLQAADRDLDACENCARALAAARRRHRRRGGPAMTVWADLNATDRDVLLAVGAIEGACGQDIRTYLAEELDWSAVSDAHVYPALSRLSSRDLVTRTPDSADPRAKQYALAPAGRELLLERRAALEDATPDLCADGAGRQADGAHRRGSQSDRCVDCGQEITSSDQDCPSRPGDGRCRLWR